MKIVNPSAEIVEKELAGLSVCQRIDWCASACGVGVVAMVTKECFPPGSDEAIAAGCTCPVIDNDYGRGCMGGVKDEQGRTVFVIRLDCPVHEEEEK